MTDEEQILQELEKNLEVYVANIQSMDEDQYAIARKKTLGASDTSVYLGLNKYKAIPQLVQEKKNLMVTDEERKVKEIVSVRKGYDLEPLILKKFSDKYNCTIVKPPHMYRHPEQQQLSVNFDGVVKSDAFKSILSHDYFQTDSLIPVEAKYVTIAGDKFYGKNPDICRAAAISIPERSANVAEHCTKIAGEIGIPPYYYSQVQQQLFFTGAPFGFLVALFEKDWELRVYLVKRDEFVINQILIESAKLQARIESMRKI